MLRRVCSVLLRLGWRVRVHGLEHVPAQDAAIIAGNHTGLFDGPLLFGVCPRTVHVLTKEEVFVGPLGAALRAAGQIPVRREGVIVDYRAVTASLDVLTQGRLLGIYPEGTRGVGDFRLIKGGVAYLALRTGAPIVPVASFEVCRPGENVSTPPPPGRRLDVVFGPPFDVEPPGPWGPYLTRALMTDVTEQVRLRLVEHLAYARELTGCPSNRGGPRRSRRRRLPHRRGRRDRDLTGDG